MTAIVLGIGELVATKKQDAVVKVFGLGSCVAVIIIDPIAKVVGVAHVALPTAETGMKDLEKKPGYYADQGVPALLQAMKRVGSTAKESDLIVKLVGGAMVMSVGGKSLLNIGYRNVIAIRKILWQLSLGAQTEDTGGQISRSVVVDVDSQKVIIVSAGRGVVEI